MFFVYGADGSQACDKAEFILYTLGHDYRHYVYGRDYTLNQLQKLVPGATSVPQIFFGTKYIGGIKELYEYLYQSEYHARRFSKETGHGMLKGILDNMDENPKYHSDNPDEK
jgi:glutaredoxin